VAKNAQSQAFNKDGRYEQYITSKQLKDSTKKYKLWLEKAKTRKDWRPKQTKKKGFMSDQYATHLFQADKEIKKQGQDWIFDELEQPDEYVL